MNWIADSGHAWLKVNIMKVLKSGIVKDISDYSYKRGMFVYLEEDCDAGLYLKAIGHDGKGIKSSYSNKSSRVRNYKRFWEGMTKP